MKRLLLICTLVCTLFSCTSKPQPPADFSLHLFVEPQQFDPAKYRSSSASYFFMSLMRGLYKFDDERGLVPEGGDCQWNKSSKMILLCTIRKSHKWSDGQPVVSADYVRAFQHLINPNTAAPRADILFTVENAPQILEGKMPVDKLGIQEITPHKFSIKLNQPDPYFLIKLSSTALFPKRKDNPLKVSEYKKFKGTGPYQVSQWKTGQWLQMTPNPHFSMGHPKRPNVRFYFVDSDLTALRLYEQGQLDLLRRLPSNLIAKFKDRKDFLQIPMARFDYVGYGQEILKDLKLREALALSLNYGEFAKLLHALGPPGCPSIPKTWMDKQPCLKMNLAKAKKLIQQSEFKNLEMTLAFSQRGGEDVQKQAEWLENQWKKNLGLTIRIRPVEQKTFLSHLKTKPFHIYRKGVGVDLPICLKALETFAPYSRQNYSGFSDSEFNNILDQLRKTENALQQKVLCRKGIERLLAKQWFIPLGEMHFTFLARDRYKGWKINSTNQLDLSNLHLSLVSKK